MKPAVCLFVLIFVYNAQARTKVFTGTPQTVNLNTAVIFSEDGVQVCSGALIHPEWILTSATCVAKTIKYDMRVSFDIELKAGIFDKAYFIKKQVKNDKFDSVSLANDIGLIQIEEIVDKKNRIIKLPSVDTNLDNMRCTVKGFGMIADGGTYGKLSEKASYIIPNVACAKQVPVDANKLCIAKNIICEGDQGAPLLINNERLELVAVASAKDNNVFCGDTIISPYSVFTRVFPYKVWIKTTTGLDL